MHSLVRSFPALQGKVDQLGIENTEDGLARSLIRIGENISQGVEGQVQGRGPRCPRGSSHPVARGTIRSALNPGLQCGQPSPLRLSVSLETLGCKCSGMKRGFAPSWLVGSVRAAWIDHWGGNRDSARDAQPNALDQRPDSSRAACPPLDDSVAGIGCRIHCRSETEWPQPV
jgi:hypothetical protein